ncbi:MULTISPECIES: TIGR03773 family transporter-associated surface protein [Actinosynnema]|uniref:TIGR03773 family transporter-associated surface protein n=1 Tax=Actinosynnema TaxID=40566 RepID=UPI0020A2B6B8|nr:TIGR03773 family transporter-associated surface protein [Actinosynnema pretiosum]MCP2096604.1 putative ABC transporter-associated repeat protein [Actinosynnema pretiosum]
MSRLIAAAAVVAAVAVAAIAPAAQAQAQAQDGERVVIADGHVDLGPRVVDGKWVVQLRDDSGAEPVWREPGDVVLHVPDSVRTVVPDDPAYAFLGTAGSEVWVLPQAQSAGVVWPGWNTQDPSIAGSGGREVDWRLHGVTGPGGFELFLNGNFGKPEVVFSGAKGFPQETGVELGTHAHGNWVFTAPGSYALDVEMAAADGRADRAVLRVHVGGGDPNAAFAVTPPSGGAPTGEESAGGESASGESAGGEREQTPWPWIGGAAAAVLAIGFLLRRKVVRSRG